MAAGGTVLEVTDKILSAITRRDNPQMVVGVFAQKFLPLGDIRAAGDDVWVALDRVRDPGNLGTVIRTVDAVGAKGVILVGETTDPFSLETVRATMGSVFAVPVATCDAGSNSSPGARAFRASSPARISRARSTTARVDFAGRPVLLLMGNEQQGLPDELAASLRPAAAHPAGRSRQFAQSRRGDRRHAVRNPARRAEACPGSRRVSLRGMFPYAAVAVLAVALDQWIKQLVETGLPLQEKVDHAAVPGALPHLQHRRRLLDVLLVRRHSA